MEEPFSKQFGLWLVASDYQAVNSRLCDEHGGLIAAKGV